MIYLMEYDPVDRVPDQETEHRLGRELLRFALERDYGGSCEVVQEGHAKPFLKGKPEVDFSIAHTRGLVVCGISGRRIGVDAEHIRQFDERLMRRICTREEITYIMGADDSMETREERFFCLWTLKESFLKATGQGLSFPMKEIRFSFRTRDGQTTGIRGEIPGWEYTRFRYGESFVAAVCKEKKSMF